MCVYDNTRFMCIHLGNLYPFRRYREQRTIPLVSMIIELNISILVPVLAVHIQAHVQTIADNKAVHHICWCNRLGSVSVE